MGGEDPPFFFGIKYLRTFKRAVKNLAARQSQNMSQARVTRVNRLNDQLGFTRTCIKIPCNYVFINLILNPVSFDDEKR